MNTQSGTYRTDASTTSWVAVSLSVSGETFDVSASFLSGMSIEISIQICAPALGQCQKLRPDQIHQILKDANGVTEATRLWYRGGKLRVSLTLHVDDGSMFDTHCVGSC